ncbi:MAG: hypothetical protein U0892_06380 [Pirellulales bacterium]
MQILRSIAAVILGFVVASVLMVCVESFNGKVLYPELGKAAQGLTDRAKVAELMASAPTGALLVVIFGWGLGGFVGGIVATLIAGRRSMRPGIVLAVLLTLAGLANDLMLGPPIWFWPAGLLVLFGATTSGAKIFIRKPEPVTTSAVPLA